MSKFELVPAEEDGGEKETGGEHEGSQEEDEHKFTLIQAIALNTLMMFGTGPFITIPFCIASVEPAGPQAMIGYAIAGCACLCDSFVWAELGALYPHSGGSYVYLERCLGPKWGSLMSFLFLWQLLITGPMEIASGFIACAQYLAYITETYTFAHHSLVACGLCVTCVLLLYRDMKDVGETTVILWLGMIGAIIFTIVAGFSHVQPGNFDMPPIPNKAALIWSLGNAARFGIYDFTGYYDVNLIGDEVQDPRRTIPIAGIVTCSVVCVVYFLTYLGVLAYLPWQEVVALVEEGGDNAAFIMSIFCEKMIGRGFAIFFTLVVIYCIYGSCFSLMLGFAQIPYAAAKNGMFFKRFAHEHEDGFADNALLFMGGFTCIFCFVDLGLVIEGMMTTTLLTMFLANSLALVVHRRKFPDHDRPYEMPCYPLPVIIQVVMFGFVFITSDNYIIMGLAPLFEFGMLFLAMGVCAFLMFQKQRGLWPFAAAKGRVDTIAFPPAMGSRAKARYIRQMIDGCRENGNNVEGIEGVMSDVKGVVNDMYTMMDKINEKKGKKADDVSNRMLKMLTEVRSMGTELRRLVDDINTQNALKAAREKEDAKKEAPNPTLGEN